MTKALFIVGSYFPAQCGGPNNSLYWIGKSLVRSDVDVSVFTTSKGQEREKVLNKVTDVDGIKVMYFKFLLSHLFPFRLIWEFLLKVRSFDVVHLTSIFYPPSFICALICIAFRVRFSISPRGELDKAALIYSSRLKKIYLKISMPIFRKCDFVLVTSPGEGLDVKQVFSEYAKIRILPNYIDPPSLVDKVENKPDKHILFIGRIHPKKNIESLIQAYVRMPKNIQLEFPLVIAGKGDEEYLKYLIELSRSACGNVKFVGHVEGFKKEKLLFESLILVVPSHGENFGNVVTEALCQGTPVIASKFMPWNVLEQKNCGYFVSNDHEVLKKVILEHVNISPDSRKIMHKNAINCIKDNFDINYKSKSIFNVFK